MEALDTISALSYALQPKIPIASSPSGSPQPPLKLVLFKLDKYIQEEEFSHEFMLKGGMQLLVRLLSEGPSQKRMESAGSGIDAALSGNALAVRRYRLA